MIFSQDQTCLYCSADLHIFCGMQIHIFLPSVRVLALCLFQFWMHFVRRECHYTTASVFTFKAGRRVDTLWTPTSGATKEQLSEQRWIQSWGSYTVNKAIVRLLKHKRGTNTGLGIWTDMHRQLSDTETQTRTRRHTHSSRSPCCCSGLVKEERDWFSLTEPMGGT